MTTNKEHIESLEAGFGSLHDGMHRIELGMANKLSQLEITLNWMPEALFSNKDGTSHSNNEKEGDSRPNKEDTEVNRPIVSSKTAKLEVPKHSGEDMTEFFAPVELSKHSGDTKSLVSLISLGR